MSLFPLVAVVADRSDLADALTRRGCVPTPAQAADVLVVEASSAMDDEVRDALAHGRGVVVLGAPTSALAGVAAGGDAAPGTLRPAVRVERDTEIGEDLLARVDLGALRASGSLAVQAPARPVLAAGGVPVAAATAAGAGRVVVLTVVPDAASAAGEQSFAELVHNAVCFVAPRRVRHSRATPPTRSSTPTPGSGSRPRSPTCGRCRWPTGRCPRPPTTRPPRPTSAASSPASRPSRRSCRTTPTTSTRSSRTSRRWADGGFEVPDFYDSLVAFAPAAAPRRRAAATSSSSPCTPRTATRTARSRRSCSR